MKKDFRFWRRTSLDMRGHRAACLSMIGLLMAVFVSVPPASADSTSSLGRLASPRSKMGSATDGRYLYMFGGDLGGGTFGAGIYRYDPVTRLVRLMRPKLPEDLADVAAVWSSPYFYLFGGAGRQSLTEGKVIPQRTQISRYDPRTDQLEVLDVTLTIPTASMAGGAVGGWIYLLGGRTPAGLSREILRFSPQSQTLEHVADLPHGLADAAVTTVGSSIYLAGGYVSGGITPEVTRFDPETLTTSPAGFLPTHRKRAVAVWAEGRILVIGGSNGSGYISEIAEHVDDGIAQPRAISLPTGIDAAAALYANGTLHVLGGSDLYGLRDEVITSDLSAGFRDISLRAPSAVKDATAVFDGRYAFVFGGTASSYGSPQNASAQIWRYDPQEKAFQVMGATLPRGIAQATAVWDGSRYIYIFGGNCGIDCRRILRYEPAADTLQILPTQLPDDRVGSSSFWDGRYAYIVAGKNKGSILRYDPSDGSIFTMPTDFGEQRYMTSAVWDGLGAIIIAGEGDFDRESYAPTFHSEILRYTPSTGELKLLGHLPYPRAGTAAAFDGRSLYVFGGYQQYLCEVQTSGGGYGGTYYIYRYCNNYFTSIVKKDLRGLDPPMFTETLLPSPRGSPVAVFDGESFVVIGGSYEPPGVKYSYYPCECGAPMDQVIVYRTDPGVPTSVAARSGPAAGEVRVSWSAPSSDSFSTISGYRVYEVTGSGERLVADTSSSTSRYSATGVAKGEARSFRVSAYSPQGEGPMSAVVTATAPVEPGPPQTAVAYPGSGYGQITVTWQPPSSNGGSAVTQYRVYRAIGNGTSRLLSTVTMTWFVDTTCRLRDLCVYTIRAVNPVGEGPRSNEAAAAGWY